MGTYSPASIYIYDDRMSNVAFNPAGTIILSSGVAVVGHGRAFSRKRRRFVDNSTTAAAAVITGGNMKHILHMPIMARRGLMPGVGIHFHIQIMPVTSLRVRKSVVIPHMLDRQAGHVSMDFVRNLPSCQPLIFLRQVL